MQMEIMQNIKIILGQNEIIKEKEDEKKIMNNKSKFNQLHELYQLMLKLEQKLCLEEIK